MLDQSYLSGPVWQDSEVSKTFPRFSTLFAPPVEAKTTDHQKEIIGYVPNWDSWKGEDVGILPYC